jgi:multiple sugar transport system permease protein
LVTQSDIPDRKVKGRARARHHNRVAYLFLLPWLIGFFALTLGPLLTSLYLAFTDYDLLSAPNWIGLQNFVEMFTRDYRYAESLRVTFTYVFVSVPLKLAFALFVAMILNRGLRGLGVYRALYYIPSLIGSSVAVAILWRYVFSGQGLFNQFLALFGISGQNWVSSPDYALWTLVVLAVWQFGAPMVIFLAGLNQVPQTYYDAAKVDGAGVVAQFFRITLPLLTPVLFFNLVLEIINSFKAFTPAFIISSGTGGPIDSTLFYTLYLYQQGFGAFDMGYASAMAWVLLVIIALFTALIFRSATAWVFYQGD